MKLVGFILIIILSRFLIMLGPEWANFSPLGAFAVFAGYKYGMRGGIATFVACWLSDIFINQAYYQGYNISLWPSSSVFLFVLTSVIAHNMKSIVAMNITAVMVFFVASNFLVWTGNMYTHDVQGLIACYVFALPFLKNALISQFLFIFVLLKSKNIITSFELNRKML